MRFIALAISFGILIFGQAGFGQTDLNADKLEKAAGELEQHWQLVNSEQGQDRETDFVGRRGLEIWELVFNYRVQPYEAYVDLVDRWNANYKHKASPASKKEFEEVLDSILGKLLLQKRHEFLHEKLDAYEDDFYPAVFPSETRMRISELLAIYGALPGEIDDALARWKTNYKFYPEAGYLLARLEDHFRQFAKVHTFGTVLEQESAFVRDVRRILALWHKADPGRQRYNRLISFWNNKAKHHAFLLGNDEYRQLVDATQIFVSEAPARPGGPVKLVGKLLPDPEKPATHIRNRKEYNNLGQTAFRYKDKWYFSFTRDGLTYFNCFPVNELKPGEIYLVKGTVSPRRMTIQNGWHDSDWPFLFEQEQFLLEHGTQELVDIELARSPVLEGRFVPFDRFLWAFNHWLIEDNKKASTQTRPAFRSK